MITIRPTGDLTAIPKILEFHFRLLEAMDAVAKGKDEGCFVDLREVGEMSEAVNGLFDHFVGWMLSNGARLTVHTKNICLRTPVLL